MGDEQRNPKNLQGLLRFAMEHTKSEDPTNESHWQRMEPERLKFLEDALKSMTIDVIEEFEKALTVLNNPEASCAEQIDALQSVEDFAENTDFANNFVKIGGTKPVVACLSTNSAEVRTAAASLIAGMSQNNAFCQKHFLDINVLPELVELLTDEEIVATKAMHAISCMIRSYEPGLAAFIEIGGLECILGCLGANQEKILTKAAFLIGSLSKDFVAVKEQFIKLGAIEKLTEYLQVPDEYSSQVETMLSALQVLTDDEERSSDHLSANLRKKLREIVDKTKGMPEFEETVEYSNTLLSRFGEDSVEDTDR